MANYQYCVASNWGKGFITAEQHRELNHKEFPGNIWRIPANNQDANRWVHGVSGISKTLSEAQAIVDAEITQMQTNWDNRTEEEKDPNNVNYIPRPTAIVLEE